MTKAKTPIRIKTVEEMDVTEKASYDALTGVKKVEYDSRLMMQAARDNIEKAKAQETAAKDALKLSNDREKGIKQIIADFKKGDLLEDGIETRIKALPGNPTDEAELMETLKTLTERIKTDGAKTGRQANLQNPPKPAYSLSHSMAHLNYADLLAPMDGGRPDSTLTVMMRKYPLLYPFMGYPVQVPGATEGEILTKFYIMDGKRRYWLLPEDATNIPFIIVEGFPDESTMVKAEVVVNRARSLNVLSTAQSLTDLKTRGTSDADLRKDIGFRTGEIEKITSLFSTVIPEIQSLLKNNRIASSMAMQVAKLPKDLQARLFADYQTRLKEDANARISETNIANIRSERAAAAVNRDAPMLTDLAGGVPDYQAPESGQAQSGEKTPEEIKPAPGVDNAPRNEVNSVKSNPETPAANWQENALAALGTLRDELPSNLLVWDAFKGMVEAIEATTDLVYAASPETSAPPTIKLGKKDVENLATNRKDWGKKSIKALDSFYSTLPEDAADLVFTAYGKLDEAINKPVIS